MRPQSDRGSPPQRLLCNRRPMVLLIETDARATTAPSKPRPEKPRRKPTTEELERPFSPEIEGWGGSRPSSREVANQRSRRRSTRAGARGHARCEWLRAPRHLSLTLPGPAHLTAAAPPAAPLEMSAPTSLTSLFPFAPAEKALAVAEAQEVATRRAHNGVSYQDLAIGGRVAGRRCDQAVADALVRSIPVVVGDILAEHAPQVAFAEDDHPTQALTLRRLHPSLGERVHVRRLDGGAHDVDTGRGEDAVELLRERRRVIDHQERLPMQEPST